MNNITKSVKEVIEILEQIEDTLMAAQRNASVFYTTLKKKDADRAFRRLIALRDLSNKVFEKFTNVLDDYDIRILEIMEEEEDEEI